MDGAEETAAARTRHAAGQGLSRTKVGVQHRCSQHAALHQEAFCVVQAEAAAAEALEVLCSRYNEDFQAVQSVEGEQADGGRGKRRPKTLLFCS